MRQPGRGWGLAGVREGARWAEVVGVSRGAAARALPGTPVMRRRVRTGTYILFNTDTAVVEGRNYAVLLMKLNY